VPSPACSRPRKADNGNLDKQCSTVENGRERGDETIVRRAAAGNWPAPSQNADVAVAANCRILTVYPSTSPHFLHSPLGHMLPHWQQRQCASSTKPSCHQPTELDVKDWPCRRIQVFWDLPRSPAVRFQPEVVRLKNPDASFVFRATVAPRRGSVGMCGIVGGGRGRRLYPGRYQRVRTTLATGPGPCAA
jgi:hypothetical protein